MKAWLGLVAVGLVGIAGVAGCGGGTTSHATPKCVLNSDCHGANDAGANLVCALGFCVSPCNDSSDCTPGELCVTSDNGNACRPPEAAAKCAQPSDCTKFCPATSMDGSAAPVCPLTCGRDLTCRDQCSLDVDCPGQGSADPQKCTASHVCIDPVVDMSIYDPVTNDFKTSVTGAAGAAGGGGAGGAAGHTGVAGTAGSDGGVDVATGMGGSTGTGGGAGGAAACTGPQLQFSNVIKGDANASFTSGVAVANADTVFVFSAYHGALPVDGGLAPDASAPVGSLIYLQSFDLATGTSYGAAVPFITPDEDGPGFYVQDVAIAPTGEIVLLWGHTSPTDGRLTALFAAFMTVTGGADGGAPALHVARTVQLESVPLGRPHVTWWSANQTFVASWKFDGAGGAWTGRIKTFATNGSPGLGSVGAVPARVALNDQNQDDAQVGAVAGFMGMLVRDSGTGVPSLTIMGTDGQQVGDFLAVGAGIGVGWMTVAGTKNGFVSFYNNGSAINVSFAPTTGAGSVLPDGGAPDGGDGGMPMPSSVGTFQSTIHTGHAISDDSAVGGVGAAILEDDGAIFAYVTADGSKLYQLGSVISSNDGAEVAVTNFKGSFGVSLYNGTTGVTDVVTSTCAP